MAGQDGFENRHILSIYMSTIHIEQIFNKITYLLFYGLKNIIFLADIYHSQLRH